MNVLFSVVHFSRQQAKKNVISFIVVLFDGLVKSNIVQFSIFTSKIVTTPLKISAYIGFA